MSALALSPNILLGELQMPKELLSRAGSGVSPAVAHGRALTPAHAWQGEEETDSCPALPAHHWARTQLRDLDGQGQLRPGMVQIWAQELDRGGSRGTG